MYITIIDPNREIIQTIALDVEMTHDFLEYELPDKLYGWGFSLDEVKYMVTEDEPFNHGVIKATDL